jgi:hypothetical protein
MTATHHAPTSTVFGADILLRKSLEATQADFGFWISLSGAQISRGMGYRNANGTLVPCDADLNETLGYEFLIQLISTAGEVFLKDNDLRIFHENPFYAQGKLRFWFAKGIRSQGQTVGAVVLISFSQEFEQCKQWVTPVRSLVELYEVLGQPGREGETEADLPAPSTLLRISAERDEARQKCAYYESIAHDLIDSITYASRMQRILMEDSKGFLGNFANSWMTFRPRNVVSGDFYWARLDGDCLTVVVADCTGHGVPGAMLTFLGINLLNQIYNEIGGQDPARLLQLLNLRLVGYLQAEHGEAPLADGMEAIALRFCLSKSRLVYSSANLGFTVLRDGAAERLKNSKLTIGGLPLEDEDDPMLRIYPNDEYQFMPGDRMLIYTDGISDQLGFKGNRIAKLGHTPIQEHFAQLLPLKVLGQEFEQLIDDWKVGHEQTDDMLLACLQF